MAQTAGRRLSRKLLLWPLRLVAGVLLAIGLYLLAAWIGSSVPRNAEWREPTSGGVMIGLETNGVHTALVLPLVTPAKDWRREFPLSDIAQPNRPYTHVSISWGEREVFLDTPTWWDLSPWLILKILTRGGEGLEHVAYYVRPAASEHLRPIRLTDAQYARLIASIEAASPHKRPLVRHDGYGQMDVFYDADGRYTAVNTCNQWTGNRLADAGVRVGRWTPIGSGVMKWAASSANPLALVSQAGTSVMPAAR